MSLSLQAAVRANYLRINGLEKVDVSISGVEIEQVNAKRRPLRFTDLAAAGTLAMNEDSRVWLLWANELNSAIPKAGDQITDGQTVTWIINSVGVLSWDGRYRCVCARARS